MRLLNGLPVEYEALDPFLGPIQLDSQEKNILSLVEMISPARKVATP
jgi:hypothetical protein